MKKKEYPIVDSVEKLEQALAQVKAAQKLFAEYTQEQVDRIFLAAATAADKERIPLARLAVEETGMGIVEDKVIKNHYAAEYIYNAYRDVKTCGVIAENKEFGTKTVAESIGVIGAVIPTTNPTSTAIFKTLIALKTRNGIIISPHPRAKQSTIAAAKVGLEAAVAAGAPEGIIAWIDVPSLDMTNLVMKESDIILATGGPGMVKAAYSSGKPALGVGAGNTPAIIDDSADIILAVNSIIHSKTFDNGMICASEQSVIVLSRVYDAVKKEFAKRGCYFLNPRETEKVRKTIIVNGALNAKIVGQRAAHIAELASVKVPADTKILIGEVESVELSEEFAHEKLSPVLAMYRARNIQDAFEKAEHLIADGGYGHTSSIYLNTVTAKDKLDEFAERMKTCRILVNTPSSQGGIGDIYNFMLKPLRNPALTVIAMMAIVIAPVTVVSVNYGPKIVNQIANFASSMPDLVAKTGRWVKDSHPEIVSLADSIGAPDGVRLFLADPEKYARELSAGDIVGKGGSAVQYGRSAANVARGLFSALLTIIFFVCFITMPPVTGRKVVGYLPMLKPATADFIAEQFDRFCDIVSGFFCRQVFICLLEGCLYGAGFRWVAHLPHGFLIGFMLGALNIVPFFGSAVGLAVALPLAVLGADGSSTRAILVLAVWGAGQILDGWVITPVIQGGKTKLSYPAIIFSFLFWGTVFNTFLGMLLAIPMSAFCKVLWDSLRTKIKGCI